MSLEIRQTVMIAGIAFAVLLPSVQPVVLAAAGRPWLGVGTQDHYDGLGPQITMVVKDGPADRAGIRVGDRIVAFDGRSIESAEDLGRQVGEALVDRPIPVRIRRLDGEETVSVRLIHSDRPEAKLAQASQALLLGEHAAAVRILRPLAETGNAEAQAALAHHYLEGLGVEKDAAQAADWCRRAADAGLPRAEAQFGYLLAHGQGVRRDMAAAARYWELAAAAGERSAQLGLGNLYLTGEGRARDPVAARRWLTAAAAQGSSEALELLAGLDGDGASQATGPSPGGTLSEAVPELTLHAVALSPKSVPPGGAMTLEWEFTASVLDYDQPTEVELSYEIMQNGSSVYRSEWRSIPIRSDNRTRKSIQVSTGARAGRYALVARVRWGELEQSVETTFQVQ